MHTGSSVRTQARCVACAVAVRAELEGTHGPNRAFNKFAFISRRCRSTRAQSPASYNTIPTAEYPNGLTFAVRTNYHFISALGIIDGRRNAVYAWTLCPTRLVALRRNARKFLAKTSLDCFLRLPHRPVLELPLEKSSA